MSTAKQHTTPREPLFGPVPLSGENPAQETTASPNYSADVVVPVDPKGTPEKEK